MYINDLVCTISVGNNRYIALDRSNRIIALGTNQGVITDYFDLGECTHERIEEIKAYMDLLKSHATS